MTPTLTLAPVPGPAWPVTVLAAVQLADAAVGLRPLPFVARCLEDVGWPRELWWTLPTVKIIAGVALLLGVWVPYLGTAASLGVVAYFVVAIGLHLRARDIGRNLVGATLMLLAALAVTTTAFGGTT